MEAKQITKNEWYTIEFTEKEWAIFHQCVCFTDYGITLEEEGPTVLQRDTLWMLLCELNKKNHPTNETELIKRQLETLLYPQKEGQAESDSLPG